MFLFNFILFKDVPQLNINITNLIFNRLYYVILLDIKSDTNIVGSIYFFTYVDKDVLINIKKSHRFEK